MHKAVSHPANRLRRVHHSGKIPRYVFVFLGIALLATGIELAAVFSPGFADWFNATIGAFVRACLAHLTSWIPFSLAEFLLCLAPVFLVLIAIRAYRRHCGSWRKCLVFLVCILSVFSLFFSLFVFSFGTGYRATPLPRKMGFETAKVTVEELADTAEYLVSQVNSAANGVSFGEDGFSLMPYSLSDLNGKLLAAYDTVSGEYSFIQTLNSRVKPVLASKAMSYTHITGVYSYFTGEANLNTYFPDYTLPYTAAHELAHQRGIAREEEANFVAFLVCAASDDAYIQYSAYRNLFEYVASALYHADSDAYFALLDTLDARVINELRAYNAFFEPFRDSTASKISDTVNDGYLKFHGSTEGTASYGLVVDLAVAYLREVR